jgi:alpha-L-fucosidase
MFEPNLKSLKTHVVPDWYHDAKFGIFIHWSLSSVPAYAPCESGHIWKLLDHGGWPNLFKNTPYAEWYLNSLRIEGSPVYQYHMQKYGKDVSYDDFKKEFNASIKEWNPNSWTELFKKIGAKYVVLVTKHHDGFTLFQSKYPNPNKKDYCASRDVVKELTDSVRNQGMKMGFYYSGTLDWSFNPEPIKDFPSNVINGPDTVEYAEYAENHFRELIDTYKPSILWNDIGYPPRGKLNELIAHYYNQVEDGLVNDRWSIMNDTIRKAMKSKMIVAIAQFAAKIAIKMGATGVPAKIQYDYTTPEYATFKKIKKKKWECVRGIGLSFGYNQMETDKHYASIKELVHMLIDIVSKNGNFLLNVGPMKNGTIPQPQLERVLGIGKWLDTNGDAIFGTRPWIRPKGTTADGIPIRYTKKANTLYTILLDIPKSNEITIKNVNLPNISNIQLLGADQNLEYKKVGKHLSITIPNNFTLSEDLIALSFKIIL